MRITGGRLKGVCLTPLKGLRIRPTSEKVREAIFNLVGQDITEFRILDLFAGTGILGIEALSRGAGYSVFIDKSIHAMRIIRKNVQMLHLDGLSLLIKKDLRKGLPEMEGQFHLVFVDPPYGRGLIRPVMESLGTERYLADISWVVVECHRKENLSDSFGPINKWKERIYGDTKITIYLMERGDG